MCKGDTYQTNCAMQEGVRNNRARANEDEEKCPDEFSKDWRHVLLRKLSPHMRT